MLFCTAAFLFVFLPLLYLFLTSVKPPGLLLVVPPRVFFKPSLQNYLKIIVEEGYYQYYLNSFLVAAVAMVLTLAFGAPLAYGFARYAFPGKRLFSFLIVITRMFMPVSTLIPIYMAAQRLGLIDTRTYLILVYAALQLSLAFYVLTAFFSEVPGEIIESAEIDGCSPLGVFMRVAVPLTVPGLIAVGILIFVFNWNEFMFALVLTSIAARTAPVALTAFSESEGALRWGELATLGFSMSVPALLFMAMLRKYLVKGMLTGALKG